VARVSEVLYFVEVKYRRSDRQGSGLECITPRKLEQMQLAAEYWLQENARDEAYQLAAVEVSGPAFMITDFVESLT
jgi:Holliday junction resolvase-like predicted endonuclease